MSPGGIGAFAPRYARRFGSRPALPWDVGAPIRRADANQGSRASLRFYIVLMRRNHVPRGNRTPIVSSKGCCPNH